MSIDPSELTPEIARRLTVDPEPWLSCDDCFRQLDEYVERLLSDGDPAAMPEMRAHLAGCIACRDEAMSVVQLAAADAGVDPAEAERNLRFEG